MAESDDAGDSLSRLMLRYTLLRFGVFGIVYALAAAVMVPLLPNDVAWLDAGLVAVVVGFLVAARVGKPLREQIAAAVLAKREASVARDRSDDERIEAARQARAAAHTDAE